MLESISREKRETCYLYVIHMKDKNVIKLGRANDSDVRMTDISVSRNHAFLKLIDGCFYLEDNFSKFGSLVLVQNELLILPNRNLGLQCGKLFLSCNIGKTFIAWFRCYTNKKLLELTYNDYLEDKTILEYKNDEKVNIVNTDYSHSFESGRVDSKVSNIYSSNKSVDDEKEDPKEQIRHMMQSMMHVENVTRNEITCRVTESLEVGHNFITTALNITNYNNNQSALLNLTNLREREMSNILNNNDSNANLLLRNNNKNYGSTKSKKSTKKAKKPEISIKNEISEEKENETVFKCNFNSTIAGRKKDSEEKLLKNNTMNNFMKSQLAPLTCVNFKTKFSEISNEDYDIEGNQQNEKEDNIEEIDNIDNNIDKDFNCNTINFETTNNNFNPNKDNKTLYRTSTVNNLTNDNQTEWIKSVVDNIFGTEAITTKNRLGTYFSNQNTQNLNINLGKIEEESKKVEEINISDYENHNTHQSKPIDEEVFDKSKLKSFHSNFIELKRQESVTSEKQDLIRKKKSLIKISRVDENNSMTHLNAGDSERNNI